MPILYRIMIDWRKEKLNDWHSSICIPQKEIPIFRRLLCSVRVFCYILLRTASYFIMSLCCHVILRLGHATRVPVEQSVPVMVARAVFISLHAGLAGVTLYPPVAVIYPCMDMAAHENWRIRPDTGPADAPASIIYMYSRTLPACSLT